MTVSLLPPAERRAINLPHHHRRDIWLRVWSGFSCKQKNELPLSKDVERRARCERSLRQFIIKYFPHRARDLAPVHEALIQDYERAILSKSALFPMRYAFAAPRSCGKTTIGDIAIIWAVFYGHRNFVLYIGAAGDKGPKRLAALRNEILTNPHLADDFPDIVGWLLNMHGGEPRRAPPDFPWNADEVRLPNKKIIAARGIDTNLTGMNVLGERPDLIIMDDLEDEESVKSEAMTKGIENKIRLIILKLHQQGAPAAYFFICTIRARGCIAARYTDPKTEPEWRGKRYRALAKEPERTDLWDKFAELCRSPQVDPATFNDTDFAQVAVTCAATELNEEAFTELTANHQVALRFYAQNKAAMDAGAEMLDPKRLPLHLLMYEKWRDPLSFACELQNDPPEDENKKTVQLDVEYILARRVSCERGIVPRWAEVVTATVDVGIHVLHWQVDAHRGDRLNALVDQGSEETGLNAGGEYRMTDVADVRYGMVAAAIKGALARLREKFAKGYMRQDGGWAPVDLAGVDCGGTVQEFAWYQVVQQFANASPGWLPLKGASDWPRTTADRAGGQNWIREAANNPYGRVDCNTMEYKLCVSRAYGVEPRDDAGAWRAGARILHQQTPKIYAEHQTSERFVTTADPKKTVGKDMHVGWHKIPGKHNHWWDTAWMAFALFEIWIVYNPIKKLQAERAANAKALAPAVPNQLPGWVQRERF